MKIKRWVVRGLLALLCLGLASCLVLYVGLKGGWPIERRLSRSVQSRPGDCFAFDGLTPALDGSLTIGSPSFKRSGLEVSAERVTVWPNYGAIVSGAPSARRFVLENARVVKGNVRFENLEIDGAAPVIKGGLTLEGTFITHVAGLPLGDAPVVVKGPFSYTPDGLVLDDLLVVGGAGEARGRVFQKRNRDGSTDGEVHLDFGQKSPQIRLGDDLTLTPRGVLDVKAHVPQSLATLAVDFPLRDLGLLVETATETFDLHATSGSIKAEQGSLLIDEVLIDFDRGARLTLGGGAANLGSPSMKVNLSLRGESIPVAVLAGFLSPSARTVVARLPATSQIDVSATVTGSPTQLQGAATIVPKGVATDIPLDEITLPFQIVDGGFKAKIFKAGEKLTVHGRFEPAVQLQVAGMDLSLTGTIQDLTREKQLDVKARAKDIPVAKVLAALPAATKERLTERKLRLQGTIDELSVVAAGTTSAPEVGALINPTGLEIRHAALKGRSARFASGTVTGSQTGPAVWKNVKVNIGGLSVRTAGSLSAPSDEGTFLDTSIKGYIPFAELPPLLGLEKSLRAKGRSFVTGSVSGRAGEPALEGTLESPGENVFSLLGAKRPFVVDGTDMTANWRFDHSQGVLNLTKLGGTLVGGLLSGSVSLGVLMERPSHSFEIQLSDMDLSTLLSRGANLTGLASGKVTLEAQGKASGTGSLENLTGTGRAETVAMKVNGSRLIEIARWDRYFPAKDKKHKSFKGALFQFVAETVAQRSKTLSPLLTIRDALHHTYDFGTVQARVQMKSGQVHIEPITSEGGPSKLSGYLRISVANLELDGLLSATIHCYPNALEASDIAIKGTASQPRFILTKSVTKTFALIKYRPAKDEKEQ